MKIVVSEMPPYFVDLDAPVLGATEVTVDGRVLWRVWCKHCGHHHYHGPAEGHREAHCQGPTPYAASGYNLAADIR
jgi:hypothetical protein